MCHKVDLERWIHWSLFLKEDFTRRSNYTISLCQGTAILGESDIGLGLNHDTDIKILCVAVFLVVEYMDFLCNHLRKKLL